MHPYLPHPNLISRADFGPDFHWGVATAAYQIEGAHLADGKGPSIWDRFVSIRGKIKNREHGNVACDFYHRSESDLDLAAAMSIQNFRFSIGWSRVLPAGVGAVNQMGLDYYDRLVDQMLARGIAPWPTLYHWDPPLALEQRGGWTNRDILGWFEEYCQVVVERLGDRVGHWMVLNEPMVFTGAGHFLGIHAPGRRGFGNFVPAMLHATLAMGVGGQVVRALAPQAQVGTTFSCSQVTPLLDTPRHREAAERADILFNRLYVEPLLGMGFPVGRFRPLRKVYDLMRPEDEANLPFNFDFWGIQNYTREVVAYSWLTPYIQARLMGAAKRGVQTTLMGWEVYPPSIFHMLMQFASYPGAPPLLVTENGAAFTDTVTGDAVHDLERTQYLHDYLQQVRRAQLEGVDVRGYFVWTFLDNFEWAEGYRPRFGLVHVDFATQQRRVKDSGRWFAAFLQNLSDSDK